MLKSAAGAAQRGIKIPGSNNWNAATNWTPATVPNGASDIATFGVSTITNPSISSITEVNEMFFGVNASAYTINSTSQILTISGVGIVNNSGTTQTFVWERTSVPRVGSYTLLHWRQCGKLHTLHREEGPSLPERLLQMSIFVEDLRPITQCLSQKLAGSPRRMAARLPSANTSTAANGTFTAEGASVFGAYGGVIFVLSGSAGNASFTNNGAAAAGQPTTGGGETDLNTATADGATFTNNGGSGNGAAGGKTDIFSSTLGDSTVVNNPALAVGASAGSTTLENF